MKTSNKLLAGLCVFAFSILLMGMVVARKNMVINDLSDSDENVITQVRVLMDTYESNILNLDGGEIRHYTLDPSTEGISVKAESEILEQMKVTDDHGLYFYRFGDTRINKSIKVTIGIKGKSGLVINLSNESRLHTSEELTGDMRINLEDSSSLELQYRGGALDINAQDKSTLTLKGRARRVSLISEDKSSIHGSEFFVDTLALDLSNKTFVKLKGSKHVSGELEDKATLKFVEPTITSALELRDHVSVMAKQR